MFAGVRAYVVQNLLPAYREFCAKRHAGGWGENQQLRAALYVAGALYHLREQFPHQSRPSYRELAAACDDYALVRDVWNAAKHHDCDRNDTRVSSAEQLYEMLISTRYEDEQGEYVDARPEVFVSLNDSTERLLAEMFHNVMEMWRAQLRDLGVINLPPQSQAPTDLPRTRAEVVAYSDRAAIGITKGEAATLRMKVCRYDYVNGRSEAVDLTGAKIEMRVYKLPTSAPITITDPVTNRSFDIDLPLSKEQAKAYMGLHDREKEMAFLAELLQADASLVTTVLQRVSALRHQPAESGAVDLETPCSIAAPSESPLADEG